MSQPSGPSRDAARHPKAPPFRPDPELMWNLDGNAKRAKKDADAVRDYLRELDEALKNGTPSEG